RWDEEIEIADFAEGESGSATVGEGFGFWNCPICRLWLMGMGMIWGTRGKEKVIVRMDVVVDKQLVVDGLEVNDRHGEWRLASRKGSLRPVLPSPARISLHKRFEGLVH
ncbi:hypothetical protein Dimus_007014, partial [Dionaea muscipula]